MTYALEMQNISKRFPGVVALDRVTLQVGRGEIHSVVGENGAGKSTLMKILSGAYRKDEGTILLDGLPIEITSPQSAIDAGIGTVYQNLNLIPDLTVADNIFMNRFAVRCGVAIDRKATRLGTEDVLGLMGCDISPSAIVADLSVADQQMVAIARVLVGDIRVLILDEPTSSLSPQEAERLFVNMRSLAARGVSIIFISHHMEEIFNVAERVTVLRDGGLVGSWGIGELDEASLVHHMVGREVREMFPKAHVEIGEEILRVSHISVTGWVDDVSFSLRRGEILGIGGLVGAGRTELVKAIFGAIAGRSGEIFLDGEKVAIDSPEDAVRQGLAFIPENRRDEGLLSDFSVEDNIVICNLQKFTRGIFVDRKSCQTVSDRVIREMAIKTPSRQQIAKNLSGGNQQKLVLGKWFLRNPRVIIFDEPTRGIDVGAKAEIHRTIGELAKNGVGVIVVSSELPELMGISDRILTLSKGKLKGEFDRRDFTAERIMLAATA